MALSPTPGGANARAAADTDRDGQNNRAEYVAGTNPQNPGDGLRTVLFSNSGTPTIRFVAVAGKTYTVQYKTTLTDATRLKLTDVAAQQSTVTLDLTDPAATGLQKRFYRVATPKQ